MHDVIYEQPHFLTISFHYKNRSIFSDHKHFILLFFLLALVHPTNYLQSTLHFYYTTLHNILEINVNTHKKTILHVLHLKL